MISDERYILERLLHEIDFFQKGGVVRLLDTPLLLKSLFQDAGDYDTQPGFEYAVTNWLRARITEIKNTSH